MQRRKQIVFGGGENMMPADNAGKGGYAHAEDIAQKSAVQYFGAEIIPWLNIRKKVKAVAPTEFVKVEMRHLYEDFNFIMEDGVWYHFEFESDRLTRKDLKRFREYEATTSAVRGVDVVTCVISSYPKPRPFLMLHTGINKYRVRLIRLKNYHVETVFERFQEKASSEVGKKDLIPVALCPLLGGGMSMLERVKRGFQILKKPYAAVEKEDMSRMQAILYVLAQKFLDEEEMNEIKEVANMTYLGQLIFNDGMIAGEKRGMELGMERGMERGILAVILDNLAFGVSREEILTKLQKHFDLDPEKAEEYMDRFTN